MTQIAKTTDKHIHSPSDTKIIRHDYKLTTYTSLLRSWESSLPCIYPRQDTRDAFDTEQPRDIDKRSSMKSLFYPPPANPPSPKKNKTGKDQLYCCETPMGKLQTHADTHTYPAVVHGFIRGRVICWVVSSSSEHGVNLSGNSKVFKISLWWWDYVSGTQRTDRVPNMQS